MTMTKGTAVVQVVVELNLSRPWQGTERLTDVFNTGSREAKEIIEKALGPHGRIISTRVKAVTAEEE